MSDTNPILFHVGNIPVREKNDVRLSLNANEYKRVAELMNSTNLSASVIIANLGQPCCKCGNKEIQIVIAGAKGVLSVSKVKNGRSTVNRLKENDK